MFSLEEKLRPKSNANDAARDVLGLGLLLALAGVMLIPISGSLGGRFFDDVVARVTSPYLLPAMGFLLGLRCGAIDLSVWVSASIGGIVTAAMINSGVAGGPAMLMGIAVGGSLGVINGLLVALVRLPSALVTILTAVVVMWFAQVACDARTVTVPEGAFNGWYLRYVFVVKDQGSSDSSQAQTTRPELADDAPELTEHLTFSLTLTRMLLVAGVYSFTMLVMLTGNRVAKAKIRLGPRGSLVAVLCASGMLAAAGGVFWVLEYGAAPIATRPVGDLRILAAAVLAGALLFTGEGRTLLAGVCLPIALLLSTIWRQEVWNLPFHGYSLQLILLTGMVLVTQVIWVRALWGPREGRVLLFGGAVPSVIGLLIFAGAAAVDAYAARRILHATGLGIWGVGALVFLGAVGTHAILRRLSSVLRHRSNHTP